MNATLARRLGRTNALTAVIRNIAGIEPDRIGVPANISELGMAVRARDREAIAELGRILIDHPSYPRLCRKALLEQMALNADLRGFAELYTHRWEIELSLREANMVMRAAGLAREFGLDETHTKREVFQLVASSLLCARDIRTDAVDKSEKEFLERFLSRPHFQALEIDYHGKPAVPKTMEYLETLQAMLAGFVGQRPRPSEAFFDVICQLAAGYAAMDPDQHEQYRCTDYAVPYHQLSALILEPRILCNPRFEKTLELIAGMEHGLPVSTGMFVQKTDSGYLLDEDMAIPFSDAAVRFASNPLLWRRNMVEFIISVAQALAVISKNDPEGTRRARRAMLGGASIYKKRIAAGFEYAAQGHSYLTMLQKRLDEVARLNLEAEIKS